MGPINRVGVADRTKRREIKPWDPKDLKPRVEADEIALDICCELIVSDRLTESEALALEYVANGFKLLKQRLARLEPGPHNED